MIRYTGTCQESGRNETLFAGVTRVFFFCWTPFAKISVRCSTGSAVDAVVAKAKRKIGQGEQRMANVSIASYAADVR